MACANTAINTYLVKLEKEEEKKQQIHRCYHTTGLKFMTSDILSEMRQVLCIKDSCCILNFHDCQALDEIQIDRYVEHLSNLMQF